MMNLIQDFKKVIEFKGQKLAFFDTETTGLNKFNNDKIVEIAIVFTDVELNILGVFDTLINPQRDIGPTWIHRIKSHDIIDAPSFNDLSHFLGLILDNCILVGHNVGFDIRFLERQFSESGIDFRPGEPLCTMKLAEQLGLSRKLSHLAEELNVEIPNHAALVDTMATVQVAKIMLSHSPSRQQFLSPSKVYRSSTANILVSSDKDIKTLSRHQILNKFSYESFYVYTGNDLTNIEQKYVEDLAYELYMGTENLRSISISLGEKFLLSEKNIKFIHRAWIIDIFKRITFKNTPYQEEIEFLYLLTSLLDVKIENDRLSQSIFFQQEKKMSEIKSGNIIITGESLLNIDRQTMENDLIKTGFSFDPKQSVSSASIVFVPDFFSQSKKAQTAMAYKKKKVEIFDHGVLHKMVGFDKEWKIARLRLFR